MVNPTDPLQDFIGRISFRLVKPMQVLPRGFGGLRQCLERFGIHLDVLNTRLPEGHPEMHERLRKLRPVPRMSTIAIAAIVNRAVALMPASETYLNIGVWHGFSLLAGMLGHPDKTCIGVDNFCKFGGPRAAFRERFARYRGAAHHFHEMDYAEYLPRVHQTPLGVYYFDGPHTREHQFNNLRLAERFFAPGCVILVDDINGEAARQGTLDFIAQSSHSYRVLLNQRTSRNCHPTYWNGLMVLRYEA